MNLVEYLREGVGDTGFVIKSAANINATMSDAADRIESLEQLAKEMAEALEIAGEMASQAMFGYGCYKPDNPHNFWPDIECCTPEEIANHSAACEAYDKGERIGNKPWGIGTYTEELPDVVVKALSRYREVCGGEK